MNEAPEWVVVRYDVQPPELRCERCGAREALRLPMSVTFLLGGAGAWAERHADCEELLPAETSH